MKNDRNKLTDKQIEFIEWMISIDARIIWNNRNVTKGFLETIIRQGNYRDASDKERLNIFRNKYKQQYKLEKCT